MGCFSSVDNIKRKRAPTIRSGISRLKMNYNINPKILGSGSFGKVF